jgi:hypothetical protein
MFLSLATQPNLRALLHSITAVPQTMYIGPASVSVSEAQQKPHTHHSLQLTVAHLPHKRQLVGQH